MPKHAFIFCFAVGLSLTDKAFCLPIYSIAIVQIVFPEMVFENAIRSNHCIGVRREITNVCIPVFCQAVDWNISRSRTIYSWCRVKEKAKYLFQLLIVCFKRQNLILKNIIYCHDFSPINDNLEAQALALFEEQFASAYSASDLPEGWRKQRLDTICTVKGGKRLPADAELLDDPTEHPYIRVRDVGASRYVCLTDQFQYIDDETYQAIARYIVDTDDIVISIVGTIGLIGKIHSTLNKANLTENCVRLTGVKGVTPDYLYYTLCMKKNNREIELLTVGAVQAKLPMYNIQSIDIIIPPDDLIRRFQDRMDIFNSQIEANSLETQRLEELRNVLLAKISD